MEEVKKYKPVIKVFYLNNNSLPSVWPSSAVSLVSLNINVTLDLINTIVTYPRREWKYKPKLIQE